ncbi:MAG TPA: DUF3800 domain-containing protein [Chthonomonadaceae bacterium]|nr:DUF3800 domain-containing protein [Chthonomonadaceae bacterium]
MSYLLFLDESGHDHHNMPYEVRGGIALHAGRVWSFVQGMRELEQDAFGEELHRFGTELKGHKLLDKDRFKWAAQESPLPAIARREHAAAFLRKKHTGQPPTRNEFTAYGQASLIAARGIFRLLREHEAALFASAVPKGAAKPPPTHNPEDLRKDYVFLLEWYFYFLADKQQSGLLIMDAIDQSDDRRLVRRLERYFTLTQTGRERVRWIVPSPLFVASAMAYPIQAADVVIYCVNYGFRLPARGMDAPVRQGIADEFGSLLAGIQWIGQGQGGSYTSYGIVYVPDLFQSR